MTFLELAKKVLEESKKPLTFKEIWDVAVQRGYTKGFNSKGKTPWNTMGAQLFVNVRDNNDSVFEKVGKRPARFGLRDSKAFIESEEKESSYIKKNSKFGFLEKELHPFLSFFAKKELNCYTKSISHSLSTKKEYGEWVHPDIVGCNFLFEGWENDVVDFRTSIGDISVRLCSFELKRELNNSNLRESFFQTVSNSSWANQGYLVSSIISESIMNELTRLSSSFGIGVIRLNIAKPEKSEILLPARFSENLDWDMVNKLSSMNDDFKDFIKRVKNDISNKEVVKERYNKILDLKNLKIGNRSVKNYL